MYSCYRLKFSSFKCQLKAKIFFPKCSPIIAEDQHLVSYMAYMSYFSQIDIKVTVHSCITNAVLKYLSEFCVAYIMFNKLFPVNVDQN